MSWFSSAPVIPLYEELSTPKTEQEYRELGESSTKKLISLRQESEGWDIIQYDVPDIQLFAKKSSDSPVDITKAIGIINASISKVIEAIMPTTEEQMKKSDDEILAWGLEKEISNDLQIVYSAHHAPFPVSSRELVYLRHSMTLEDGTFVVSATSINVPDMPVREKRVRAAIHSSGWVIEPIDENSCRAIRVLQLDPKGSIPMAIVNGYKKKTGLAVQKLREI